VLMFLSVAILP